MQDNGRCVLVYQSQSIDIRDSGYGKHCFPSANGECTSLRRPLLPPATQNLDYDIPFTASQLHSQQHEPPAKPTIAPPSSPQQELSTLKKQSSSISISSQSHSLLSKLLLPKSTLHLHHQEKSPTTPWQTFTPDEQPKSDILLLYPHTIRRRKIRGRALRRKLSSSVPLFSTQATNRTPEGVKVGSVDFCDTSFVSQDPFAKTSLATRYFWV